MWKLKVESLIREGELAQSEQSAGHVFWFFSQLSPFSF
jgi:hypothetical protein